MCHKKHPSLLFPRITSFGVPNVAGLKRQLGYHLNLNIYMNSHGDASIVENPENFVVRIVPLIAK
jgi:hypothetical protein